MKRLSSNEIRAGFLEYFRGKGHAVVASSSLVPGNDPTLLFTNSGMVQFKDVFLGRDKREYTRAATSQRSLRAGGKHNDLENVGYTARHHTFFEMLGNFSFGDYFKKHAIEYAWELLTKVWGLPPDRLWVTVYQEDDEAYGLWRDMIGVPAERIVRIGDNKGARYASDNFWQMADTGPCGPCSEVFYDHGDKLAGGPPGSADADGDRFVEIWNLVFMQYDRAADGTLTPLPKPCVDTGMGLERVAAVLQGVQSNYDTDTLKALVSGAKRVTNAKDASSPSLRVIADHIRAVSFLIVDGVVPSNEGRGYVLRRILRRAIRHGYKLGQEQPFMHRLVDDLDREMGEAYPELRSTVRVIRETILREEEKFFETIVFGMRNLERELEPHRAVLRYLAQTEKLDFTQYSLNLQSSERFLHGQLQTSRGPVPVVVCRDSGEAVNQLLTFVQNQVKHDEGWGSTTKEAYFVLAGDEARPEMPKRLVEIAGNQSFKINLVSLGPTELNPYKTVSGDAAFRLHDTYGFPIDLTADVARERGFTVDQKGFDAAMAHQQAQSRASSSFGAEYAQDVAIDADSAFTGYDRVIGNGRVVALFKGNEAVKVLNLGDTGIVVLDETPFYAESGGQVGDTGSLRAINAEFRVEDTQKRGGGAIAHLGTLTMGDLKLGESLEARVDEVRRAATMRNHSATHLLHAALRKVLGSHVTQKGSLVAPDRLRFDFSHGQPVAREELARIETLVNEQIRHNVTAEVREMGYDDAIKSGAMALFGEKYGSTVRVLRFGDFSIELCGGTHVDRVGDIGLLRITHEGGVAAGVRRIEAVTGQGALDHIAANEAALHEKIAALNERAKALEKQLDALKIKLATGGAGQAAIKPGKIGGDLFYPHPVEGGDVKSLRAVVDSYRNRSEPSVVVCYVKTEDGKVSFAVGSNTNVDAAKLAGYLGEQADGRGGGRKDFAQGGGPNPTKFIAGLESAPAWYEKHGK